MINNLFNQFRKKYENSCKFNTIFKKYVNFIQEINFITYLCTYKEMKVQTEQSINQKKQL